jgi:hypothetical protein
MGFMHIFFFFFPFNFWEIKRLGGVTKGKIKKRKKKEEKKNDDILGGVFCIFD